MIFTFGDFYSLLMQITSILEAGIRYDINKWTINNNKSDAEQPLNIGRGGNNNILKGSGRIELSLSALYLPLLHEIACIRSSCQVTYLIFRNLPCYKENTLPGETYSVFGMKHWWVRGTERELSCLRSQTYFFQMYVFISLTYSSQLVINFSKET